MAPAPESEASARRRARPGSAAGLGAGLVSRFALVGIGATLLYASLALLFSQMALAPIQASVLAYAVATVFSYLGQKFLAFRSSGAHRSELPKFLVLTAIGFGVATAMPAVFSGLLGYPPYVPVVATCLVVPVINLFVLDRWVFSARREAA